MRDRSKMLIALTLALTLTRVHAAEPKVAVFDFELADTGLEGATNGPRADEQLRLAWLGDELRRRLKESGRAEVANIASISARARASNLRVCGGCDAAFGSELGAKYSITGWVQKVSNVILSVNIVVRDVETGRAVSGKSVDMRGNTEESWSRALDWLVRNCLLAPNEGVF